MRSLSLTWPLDRQTVLPCRNPAATGVQPVHIDPSQVATGVLSSAIVAVAVASLNVLRNLLGSQGKGSGGDDPADSGPDESPPPPAVAV